MRHAKDVLFALILLFGSAASGPDAAPVVAAAAPEVSFGSVAATPRTVAAQRHALLTLINQTRGQNGLPALVWDDRLADAATHHAQIMAEQGTLSHRFEGEPPLMDRLTAENVRLDRASENVMYDLTVEDAHRSFMDSPPHRANLLDPAFDAIGLGLVEVGGVWYVVEDFAHRLADISDEHAAELLEASFDRLRHAAGAEELTLLSNPRLHDAAQSMARRELPDSKPELALPDVRFAASYATTDPAKLPASVARLSAVRGLTHYSVGVCYARTPKYPGGLYWVTIVLFQSPDVKLAAR
jgi:uncharacterized protein YkwD